MPADWGSSDGFSLSAWTDPTPVRPDAPRRGTRRRSGRAVAALLLAFDLTGVLGVLGLQQSRPSTLVVAQADTPAPRPAVPPPPPLPALPPPRPVAQPAAEAAPVQEPAAVPAPLAPTADPEPGGQDAPRRVLVRDADGAARVARQYGGAESTVVQLPDGRLAWTKGELAFTSAPFVAETPDALAERLGAGPFREFELHRTEHYLLFYKSTPEFARASGNLLESLLDGLLKQLRDRQVEVHEPEFPLVALIFRDEASFRAYQSVPEDVRAYYDVVSNHIVMYQTSQAYEESPDVAARLRPQTVAHEGAHQLLQNIGVQPRLASWPLWLTEGLAEYFAPTTVGKHGSWDGANKVNPFHMATLRDLRDPLTFQESLRRGGPRVSPLAAPLFPTVQGLVSETDLSPTDYALAWALTYYLANARGDAFLEYLRSLSRLDPLEPVTPEQHLAQFCKVFRVRADELGTLDRQVNRFLAGLRNYETLSYFAVTFEQPLGSGVVKRAALVSQSPARIRQWVAEVTDPAGGPPRWHPVRCPSKARARYVAEQWINRR